MANPSVTNVLSLPRPDYQPRFPADYRPGIGVIGCGRIVKSSHLPAYQKYGVRVVGVYDIAPAATEGVQAHFGVEQVFDTLDELLAHPDIEVVDIATFPAQRVGLIRQALAAGKHVLAQKPLALEVSAAAAVVTEAEQRGLKLAVNQNGRWSPAWRLATLLIQQGVIGDVLAVTHLFDINLEWVVGTNFDTIPNFAIYDYAVHWFDITRCWLDEATVSHVRAHEYRTPSQPAHGQANLGMWAEIGYANGASALIRGVNCSRTAQRGHPFWVHGTAGTLRGSVLGNDYLELEKDGITSRYALTGQWFPDGFAGTMGELLCAIAENREPYNAAAHNLRSLQMTLAACRSANKGGRPVALEEIA